jgi:hypothetical protein
MSVRLFCNVVYARLVSGCGSEDDRAQLDRELYAPLGGWEQAEANLWRNIAAAPGE